MRRPRRGEQLFLPGARRRRRHRPWNFPLAILTGMTAAALVTGNTVVMKPAEQSPIIAAKLMEIFEEVGIPDGVVNYLPGVGEEIGPELVGSPEVDLIAFTVRRQWAGINERSAHTDPRQESVKHSSPRWEEKTRSSSMTDANLDEAVQGSSSAPSATRARSARPARGRSCWNRRMTSS